MLGNDNEAEEIVAVVVSVDIVEGRVERRVVVTLPRVVSAVVVLAMVIGVYDFDAAVTVIVEFGAIVKVDSVRLVVSFVL